MAHIGACSSAPLNFGLLWPIRVAFAQGKESHICRCPSPGQQLLSMKYECINMFLWTDMPASHSCRMLGSVKDLDGLIAALDKRGAREGMLYNALLSYRDAIVQAMPAEPMK